MHTAHSEGPQVHNFVLIFRWSRGETCGHGPVKRKIKNSNKKSD